MKSSLRRSPFFYVGDKYKILPQVLRDFPAAINKFIEPFTGGGSVFLNVRANKYLLNDIDPNIIGIHEMFSEYAAVPDRLFADLLTIINHYKLSHSFIKDVVPDSLKREYVKTYYKKYNEQSYLQMRKDFNNSNTMNYKLLYLLLIYGFNRMIRFNSSGQFNLPVGNIDFNKNVETALSNYMQYVTNRDIEYINKDWEEFLDNIDYEKDDFVYLDPPYLITFSEYNKLWNLQHEKRLLDYLDKLHANGVKFAISNVMRYKGKENKLFTNWAQKYNIKEITSNYISYHDNQTKEIKEVLVTNYA
jgi:DNA adenine methylase